MSKNYLKKGEIFASYTSYTKVHFNEFVANVFHDNIGSKKNQPPSSKKNLRLFFSFKCQKITWRSGKFLLLIYFKVVSQSKYHVQSDLSYNLKHERYAHSLQLCTGLSSPLGVVKIGGCCISSIICYCAAVAPKAMKSSYLLRPFWDLKCLLLLIWS